MRFGVIGKKAGRSDDEMVAFHQAYSDDMAAADRFPIWENKTYHADHASATATTGRRLPGLGGAVLRGTER